MLAQVRAGAAILAAHGHAHGDALYGAEQVDQHRYVGGCAVRLDGLFENDRRSTLCDQPGLDLGHLQDGGDRLFHAHQVAVFFKTGDEIVQGTVSHAAVLRAPQSRFKA